MSYWREIWRTIDSDGTSTSRDANGNRVIRDGRHFHPMSPRRHQRVIDSITNEQKIRLEQVSGGHITSLSDLRANASKIADMILTGDRSGNIVSRVRDTMGNFSAQTNVPGQDPNLNNFMTPNVWIDPGEAATVYSQGGIPAFIIRKKCMPIVNNGVTIKNPRLSRDLMDKVNESSIRTGFAYALSDGARDGLTYGGALVYPVFRKDSPVTMGMTIAQLAKYGIVEKDCIDRYTVLDKNNVVHIPNWNPTARDFLNPLYYFIPYLGADVNGQRCARIVPLPQAGYWGAIMSMGWGTSDIPGWYGAACNYEQVITSIPTMIRQMSIIVRSFNVDLANALNGSVSLEHIQEANTIAMREASGNSLVSMDVIGKLEAIQRDFGEVPALTRLVRQDLGAKANIPEEKFWSSERGAFSSGDMTEGLNEGEWGGVKYVNTEVERRARNLAMLEIINALGKDRDVLAALPYTTVEIGEPRIDSAERRAKLFKDLFEGVFNGVASGAPVDSMVEMAAKYGDKHLVPDADVVAALATHQKEVYDRDKESHDIDMELKKQQLENLKNGVVAQGAGGTASGSSSSSKGYSALEQKMHEKTRGAGARREGLAKKEGSKVNG